MVRSFNHSPLQGRLTLVVITCGDLELFHFRKECIAYHIRNPFGSISQNGLYIVVIRIIGNRRSMCITSALGSKYPYKIAAFCLGPVDLIRNRIDHRTPLQGRLALVIVACNHQKYVLLHVRTVNRLISLAINNLVCSNLNQAGCLFLANGIAKFCCGSDFVPNDAVSRCIDHISDLGSQCSRPSDDQVVTASGHHSVLGQVGTNLIGNCNRLSSIAAPFCLVDKHTILSSCQSHRSSTHIHVIIIRRVVIREFALAGLGQEITILTRSSRGRCFGVATVGVYIGGQRDISIRHFDTLPAACRAHICAIVLLDILVTGCIVILNQLLLAGFCGVKTLAVNNTGRGNLVGDKLLADACHRIEVANILHIQNQPAGLLHAIDQIILIALSICHIAGILLLADVDTIGTKVVIVAIDFTDAGVLGAVFIIGEAAAFHNPTILHAVDQSVFVLEFLIGGLEVATIFLNSVITDVLEGIESEDFLIFGLAGEGVQRVCTQVDIVADRTTINNCQRIVAVPCSIVLGGQLNAAEDTHWISSSRINRFLLTLPLHDQGQTVLFLVVNSFLQREVFVSNSHLRVIQLKIIVEVQNRSDFCQCADTFCQLQQEVPCGSVLHICAWQHVGQLLQLLRHLNLAHINGKGVGGRHILFGIHSTIDVCTIFSGIADLTNPRQLSVTSGGIFKVETSLVFGVQSKFHSSGNGRIRIQFCIHFYLFQSTGFITDEYKSINLACSSIGQRHCDIGLVNGYRLTLIHSPDRQQDFLSENSVHSRLFKVDVIGDHHVNLLGTYYNAIHNQLDLCSTVRSSGKYTVFSNAANGFIGHSPLDILRHIDHVTGSANRCGFKLTGGTDSEVGIVAIDYGMVKSCRVGGSGHHHQRSGYRTGDAVGRFADNTQFSSSFFSGNIGAGTATV